MIKDLIKSKERQVSEQGYIQFSEQEISTLTEKNVNHIEKHFKGRGFMLLPQNEIDFFEWLKVHDRPVWDDLWKGEDRTYLVSLSFLYHFVTKENGFPICDLVKNENFWFTEQHIKPKGKEKIININNKLKHKKRLSVSELFLYEILMEP